MFKDPSKYDPGLGVEVELENCHLSTLLTTTGFASYWDASGDGSLRGDSAVEIKFKSAYTRAKWEKSARLLGISLSKVTPYRTSRCSTHIHVNMNPYIQTQSINNHLKNFITMSLLLEPVLFALVDPAREGSVFCKPSWDASFSSYPRVGGFLQGTHGIGDLTSGASKYSAVNLHSIHTHGSVEFRMAPAVGSEEELVFWINTIISVYGAAKEMEKTPKEWIEGFVSDYYTNIRSIFSWSDYSFTEDELLLCEQRAQVAFKMLSYYGGF